MPLSDPDLETIVAIATAVSPGQGGIAVLRISGPKALVVASNVVSIPGNHAWESHHVLYGNVMDAQGRDRIDEVLVLFMKAPRSFTGEDVVEIHCHGGAIVVNQVLELVLSQAEVRRALPGEFSQRAVLNGRLDLTQAEAICDLVAARTRKAAQLAMAGVDGGIQKRVTELREHLLDHLSEIEARVDFEEDLPELSAVELAWKISQVCLALERLIKDAERGELFRHGLKVALIGRPNVGKSSLLNLFSRSERAIVTDLPGTTRDILETELVLEGVPVTLLDTAGIRPTDDPVEQHGIARSYKALLSADVVVLMFDLTIGWTAADAELLDEIPSDVPQLVVGNKADIEPPLTDNVAFNITSLLHPVIRISALTGKGESELVNAFLEVCGATELEGVQLALNTRQKDLASRSVVALKRIEKLVEQKLPWDFWTIDLRDAIYSLGEITGEELTEAILDRVFSKFCIGK